MAIWTRVGEFLSRVAGEAVSTVIEAVRTVFEGDPETRRQVGFSVAMIALSAKMAKADGIVSDKEIAAFRQLFEIPEKETRNVARLYNLAKQDVAGYQAYARKVVKLFPEDREILEDVMNGLFHIAKADGAIHESEMAFMDEIANIFEIDEGHYARIRRLHLEPGGGDPYVQLEADESWSDEQIKRRYYRLVSENHPDRIIARGVPPEFVAIANDRMAAINKAWADIKLERGI